LEKDGLINFGEGHSERLACHFEFTWLNCTTVIKIQRIESDPPFLLLSKMDSLKSCNELIEIYGPTSVGICGFEDAPNLSIARLSGAKEVHHLAKFSEIQTTALVFADVIEDWANPSNLLFVGDPES
jgi:hypothetical protein